MSVSLLLPHPHPLYHTLGSGHVFSMSYWVQPSLMPPPLFYHPRVFFSVSLSFLPKLFLWLLNAFRIKTNILRYYVQLVTMLPLLLFSGIFLLHTLRFKYKTVELLTISKCTLLCQCLCIPFFFSKMISMLNLSQLTPLSPSEFG